MDDFNISLNNYLENKFQQKKTRNLIRDLINKTVESLKEFASLDYLTIIPPNDDEKIYIEWVDYEKFYLGFEIDLKDLSFIQGYFRIWNDEDKWIDFIINRTTLEIPVKDILRIWKIFNEGQD